MSGSAGRKKVKSPRIEMSVEQLQKIADAKQQFLSSALNMSWQLAVTILVPVFIGVQLDKRFDSAPSYTLGALFLAVFMATGVVVKTLRGVKVDQTTKQGGKVNNAK